jgi:hypothetical protein
MSTATAIRMRLTVSYDPHAGGSETLARAADSERQFRAVAEGLGHEVLDYSDSNRVSEIETAADENGLALIDTLLERNVAFDLTLDEADALDQATSAAIDAAYVKHGRAAPDLVGSFSVWQQQAAESQDARQPIEALRVVMDAANNGRMARVLTGRGLGYSDDRAIHPEYGVGPRVILDSGEIVWSAEVGQTGVLRVRDGAGREGYVTLAGFGMEQFFVREGARLVEQADVDFAELTPLPEEGPPLPALIERSVSVPVTVTAPVTAAQTDEEVGQALQRTAERVIQAGCKCAYGIVIDVGEKQLEGSADSR